MTSHEFTLILDREPSDAEVDALCEPFEGSALFEGGGTEPPVVHVFHDADAASLPEAIAEAMSTVESVGLAVAGVASEDTVSLKDIATRTGRSYEWVRRLAAGQRGPGGFPVPFATDQWSLYSWAEVSAWLATHYGTATTSSDYDRQIVAADYLIRARHLLPDSQRGELARLVTT